MLYGRCPRRDRGSGRKNAGDRTNDEKAAMRYPRWFAVCEHEGNAFNAENGVWRVAYAFDPTRRAILLVAGDKAGVSQRQFYRSLIRKADERFAEHLQELE